MQTKTTASLQSTRMTKIKRAPTTDHSQGGSWLSQNEDIPALHGDGTGFLPAASQEPLCKYSLAQYSDCSHIKELGTGSSGKLPPEQPAMSSKAKHTYPCTPNGKMHTCAMEDKFKGIHRDTTCKSVTL